MNGDYPETSYTFYPDHFRLTGKMGSETIPYRNVIRLVKDRDYDYLFISQQSAYMIDASTLSADRIQFQLFLSNVIHMRWQQPYSLLTFQLKDLLPNWKS